MRRGISVRIHALKFNAERWQWSITFKVVRKNITRFSRYNIIFIRRNVPERWALKVHALAKRRYHAIYSSHYVEPGPLPKIPVNTVNQARKP